MKVKVATKLHIREEDRERFARASEAVSAWAKYNDICSDDRRRLRERDHGRAEGGLAAKDR